MSWTEGQGIGPQKETDERIEYWHTRALAAKQKAADLDWIGAKDFAVRHVDGLVWLEIDDDYYSGATLSGCIAQARAASKEVKCEEPK